MGGGGCPHDVCSGGGPVCGSNEVVRRKVPRPAFDRVRDDKLIWDDKLRGRSPIAEARSPNSATTTADKSPMPTTHKKVVVRKMDRDSVSGYVAAQFVQDGKLELLNTSGTVISMDLREIKGVYFVREFGDSESLTRKTFTSRPRSEGLWVRLRFKDNEILEGLMPADLTQNMPEGYLVNPPDLRSNTQRIFVPRTALDSLTVLAVIGAARRRRRDADDQRQVPMFEE